MHCYLIGFRGSGKTTVGQLLSGRLGWGFVDTDQWIEQSAGRTIREIFAEGSEAAFRELESAAILAVSQRSSPTVISLGGGAILREQNRLVLQSTGCCVWLNATAELLYERIRQDKLTDQRRPSLTGLSGFDEVAVLVQQREPIYAEMANKVVMIESLSPDEIVADIADWIKLAPHAND